MRILQVIPYFPPAYAFGGPVQVAYQISKELAKRGHEITVYTTDAKNLDSRLVLKKDVKNVNGKIRIYYMKNLTMMSVKKAKLFITPKIISVVKREIRDFDIIHLHEYRTFQNIVIHHYARKCNIPYILQAHGSVPRIESWRRLKQIYDVFFGYRCLKDASKLIALNKTEFMQYKSMGISEDKIVVIPNGIDLSNFKILPPKGLFKQKYGIPGDKKIILYLGRIHRTKGIDILIKAYAYLVKNMDIKNIVLVIAGPDDGYLYEAKVLAQSLGIYNSIIFTGFISDEEKLCVLVDADIFVTPIFYGFPLTFLEACAVGTPIVTTSLGDTLEWIDDKVGYVTQPTHHNLAEAIYRIVSDDKLRRKFSRNCIKVVRSNFSLEKVVERLERVYKEVVEG